MGWNRTYEYEFIVFADGAEAVRAAVASRIVECECGDEGGVALTARDDAAFPGREDVYQVVLPASLREYMTLVCLCVVR